MSKIISLKEVKIRLLSHKIELLGRYIDTQTKTEFRCYCGNKFISVPSYIFRGRVKSCGCHEPRIKNNLFNKDFDKLTAIKLLPKDGLYRKYLCKCKCGTILSVNAKDLVSRNTRSCGCLQLEYAKSRTGKNNPSYNPNLTDKERTDRRTLLEYKVWSKQILIRDNYICNICGQNGNVVAHHLNSYHWCIDSRFELYNGICLCKDCHADFHYIYGCKWNTKEEFEEYKRNYI